MMLQNSLAAVRIWHWMMTLAMIVLVATGLLIAYPPPGLQGEASEHFLFGYIRFAHFTAGYVLAVFWLLRIYWAIVGNKYARQLFLVPLHSKAWWQEFANDLRTSTPRVSASTAGRGICSAGCCRCSAAVRRCTPGTTCACGCW